MMRLPPGRARLRHRRQASGAQAPILAGNGTSRRGQIRETSGTFLGMRVRESRKSFFTALSALTALSASIVLTVACGGGKAPDAKSPGDGTAAASSGASPGASSSGEVS